MSRLREVVKRLGRVGTAFVVTLVLYAIFYFTGFGSLAFLAGLILFVLACILAFRGLRVLQRRGLWSVRNRLLFVYCLVGVLPLLFVLTLIGVGAWALTDELAIYLATSALNQRVASLEYAVEALDRLAPEYRVGAAGEMLKAYQRTLPGIRIYLTDVDGVHRFPSDAPPLALPAGWRDVEGLAVVDHHFCGWAHLSRPDEEITAVAPLSDEQVENLVPHLGAISLFESKDDGRSDDAQPAAAGSFRVLQTAGKNGQDPEFSFTPTAAGAATNAGAAGVARHVHLPPPAFRFDIPVLWPATVPHYHLNTPNKSYSGVIWVYTRPSAVIGSIFSGTEFLRGVLFDFFVVVAVLFLLVELIAVFLGTRLARRLTGAINALYEGTRRVTRGDFSSRIAVNSTDQIGELGASFNQMTSNLERLLVVEKERERLQAELEIAREVQSQLYPKDAPPICGLKLSVQCDPARMVSGDYYDYQELGGRQLAFAIGDVAGKGISAALLMATLQAALRAQITQYQPMLDGSCNGGPSLDVAKLVSTLNKQIYAHTSPEKYATFFFAVFDEDSRTLKYTNAGHLSPLLFRNGSVTPLDSNGIVVGAFPFSKYDESRVTMSPGDMLVCYTDGITEPENAYGEEFGEQRLVDLVQKNAHCEDHEIIRIVLDAVRSWTGIPELHDDMTLLIAREVQSV